MKAFTKQESLELKNNKVFPDFVIQVFNEALKEMTLRGIHWIEQDEMIERIICVRPEYSRQDVFSNNWLDIEDFYSEAGWKVEYHKPYMYDEWKAFWSFT